MTSVRGNAKIIVIIVALAALLGIAYYWSNVKMPQQPVPEIVGTTPAPAQSPCGLTVTSPLPSTDAHLPLTVTGNVMTASSLPCRWTLFEGQLGTMEIRNATTSALIKNKVPVMLSQMDWMERAIAGQSVDFSITISSLDVAYTGPATIIFEEENPSGEGVPDMLMLNVNIQ